MGFNCIHNIFFKINPTADEGGGGVSMCLSLYISHTHNGPKIFLNDEDISWQN